ncbi:energy-coupling factor ABC transporter ATP-binding protein [Zhihengliuella halotolerans]|uniref:Biotin transport system ATP-binding protein n=1 Tax=Zhihengliuella halotolerans TaxID=370736 RepID=A0A4Q8AAS4_9MICC|nr:energy-coupling factor ABC transporter ATP-binding protein [Zhihengliuella halotolerans]RZU61240.1 biotin transport system ATP-binding protein [Zhihengliuella halotolerans]
MHETTIRFEAAELTLDDESAADPDTGAVPQRTVLSPVTLTLTERRVAVVGANGSGKSTLLKMINGLVAPSGGRVLVNGNCTTRATKRVRRDVGFLFTDPLAQLVMPVVLEDVELSLKASVPRRDERRRRALEILQRLGLEHLARRSVYDLSGGERQLVALATVLAAGQRILVADEPTTLLDLRNNAMLQRTFDSLEQQIVYATHDLDFAAQADRVIVVDHADVVFDGAPDEAVASYRRLALREA